MAWARGGERGAVGTQAQPSLQGERKKDAAAGPREPPPSSGQAPPGALGEPPVGSGLCLESIGRDTIRVLPWRSRGLSREGSRQPRQRRHLRSREVVSGAAGLSYQGPWVSELGQACRKARTPSSWTGPRTPERARWEPWAPGPDPAGLHKQTGTSLGTLRQRPPSPPGPRTLGLLEERGAVEAQTRAAWPLRTGRQLPAWPTALWGEAGADRAGASC